MRRTPVFLAVTALVAVGLVGCSASTDAASCTPASADSSLLDLIDVSGSVGSAPTVAVRAPFHVSSTETAVAVAGEGQAITADNQLSLVDMTIYRGDSGEAVASTRYSADIAQVPSAEQLATTFPTLQSTLQCAQEGSRVVVALAPDDLSPDTAAGLRLTENESLVLVVDVRKVYLAKADGADQYTESHGLPTVVRAPDGRPGVIVPETTAPTETSVQVLKRGDGAEVTGDAPVRVNYTGVAWDQPRRVFGTTWDSTPVSWSLDTLGPGLAQALQGQTVGSQVLVVVTPDEVGTSDAETAGGTGSPLVFVVDILGIDE